MQCGAPWTRRPARPEISCARRQNPRHALAAPQRRSDVGPRARANQLTALSSEPVIRSWVRNTAELARSAFFACSWLKTSSAIALPGSCVCMTEVLTLETSADCTTDTEFRRRTVGLAEVAVDPDDAAGNQDHARARVEHRVQNHLRGMEHAAQVDVADAVELLDRRLLQPRVLGDAGVVDQHVDAANSFLHSGGPVIQRFAVGDVERKAQDMRVSGAHQRDGRLDAFGLEVADHDIDSSSANFSAVASPMPWAAPAMIATVYLSRMLEGAPG
jgi:hypothetical protein